MVTLQVETALFALGTNGLSSSLLPDAFPSSCDLVIAKSKNFSMQRTSPRLWLNIDSESHVTAGVMMRCLVSAMLLGMLLSAYKSVVFILPLRGTELCSCYSQ